MAYYDLSTLAFDWDFLNRCAACVATEANPPDNPPMWAQENQWALAATPGFADAYASAIAGGVEFPGKDQAVISDAQILSAVQALQSNQLTPIP